MTEKQERQIYIAKTHDFLVPLTPQTHTTTASVNGANITCVYWHQQDRQAESARDYLLTLQIQHALIVGDFNAHHSSWHPQFRNSGRGDEIEELMASWGLNLLNTPDIPTHRYANGHSTLDLAFGTERAYMRVGAWVSDHRKLVITIPANKTLPTQKKHILPPTHGEEAYQALVQRLP
ncbi:Endonuclease/exonuclease/phosphatase, partial [Sordaria sp. MPI-SDFR-AT-0083]